MNLPVLVRLILLHAVDEAGNILHTLASMGMYFPRLVFSMHC